jgi:fluoride exporter
MTSILLPRRTTHRPVTENSAATLLCSASMLRILALVSLGGVLGAVARALIEQAWPHAATTIGWATFTINVTGCFLIGALVAAVERFTPHHLVRPFLGTGLLGGYTTFSTHIVEVHQLIANGRPGLGMAYLGLQVMSGVAAAGLGVWTLERRTAR